ncbi:Cytochrome P450 87A3 [Bienertia sinuspersici]
MVLSLFGLESLKKTLPEVEATILKKLNQWSTLDIVGIKDSTASMILNLTVKNLISHGAENSSENLRENFVAFIKGLVSFPLNIPGTAYHKCLRGRKKAMKMLKSMLHERRMMPRKENTDFFDYVLVEMEKKGTLLIEGFAPDLMFVLLFASCETTSLALPIDIRYLSNNPLVINERARLANIVPGIF